MTYEELLNEVEEEGIEVIEMDFQGSTKGLYCNNTIAISKSLSCNAEKKCVLVEELGHHHTSSGIILNQREITNRKQERRARAWGYEKLVSIQKLIDASKQGIRNKFELAEYLDVTEEYIEDAIKYYKSKYGLYFHYENYIIYFEPLAVFEKFF